MDILFLVPEYNAEIDDLFKILITSFTSVATNMAGIVVDATKYFQE